MTTMGVSGIRDWARCHRALFSAVLVYGLLTLAWTYPLVRQLGSALPHDLGDPLLNTWLLHWNAHHLPFTSAWWNGPFFYPAPGMLSLSDHLVGIGLLASPLQWLGASPVTAHNLAFLASFLLSAWAAYLLCLRLTSRPDAAFLGGLAYAFAPYRAVQLAHLQLLWSFWMPLALLGLHAYLETRRRRWLALFACAWLCQALSNGYYLFFLSLLVALWILWFAPPWRDWRLTTQISVAWGLALVPVAASLVPYARFHALYGLSRTFREIEDFSADLTAFLRGSPLLAHWQGLPGGAGEAYLYPGLTVAAILVVGVGSRAWNRATAATSRLQWVASVLAIAFASAALSSAVFGAWRFRWAGLSLSVSSVHKPLGVALLLSTLAVLCDRRVIEAHRRGSVFLFYLGAAIVTGVLCLGPTPHCAGTSFWYRAPYWWLLRLPGVTSLRVPPRFAMLLILCLAAIVALTARQLLPLVRRLRPVVVALIACGLLWDGWLSRLPLATPPGTLDLPAQLDRRGAAVLELPLGGTADVAAMYRALEHGLPLVNGYSGYEPPHYVPLRLGLARRERGLLPALAGTGALYVAVDRSADEQAGWEPWVADQASAVAVEQERRWAIYRVDGSVSSTPTPGIALPIRRIWANRDEAGAPKAADGDPTTRWTTGAPQKGREKLTVDLGSPVPVEAVVLGLGRFTTDFPRELAIEASDDEKTWRSLWQGPTAALTLAAALQDPRTTLLRFDVRGAVARFVRLRLTAADPVYHCSVTELRVLAPVH